MADNFYSKYPVTSGGGGGAVTSVNGQTGAVSLAATDVGAANQSLSNLTNPTAINQSLIADNSGVIDLGLAGNPFRAGYINTLNDISGNVEIDLLNRILGDGSGNPSVAWASRTLIDASSTLVSIDWANRFLYDGTGATISIDWASRQMIDSSGVTSHNWNLRQLYASDGTEVLDYIDSSIFIVRVPMEIIGSLTVGSITLPNNTPLQALSNLSVATPMISIDAFNRTTINGVSGTNILLNNSLIPSASDSLSLGVLGDSFANINANQISLGFSGANNGQLNYSISTPSGATGTVGFSSLVNQTVSVFSATSAVADANPTGNLLIETGNKTAGTGNSGAITLTTGTSSGGVRGQITFNALAMNAPRASAAPTGTFVGGAIYYDTTLNKLRVYNGTAWQTITSV
jgi:hypothetical protein